MDSPLARICRREFRGNPIDVVYATLDAALRVRRA